MLRKRGGFINTMEDLSTETQLQKLRTSQKAANAMDYVNTSHSNGGDFDEVIPLTTKDLVCFSFQIARGMEYLASRKVLSTQLFGIL